MEARRNELSIFLILKSGIESVFDGGPVRSGRSALKRWVEVVGNGNAVLKRRQIQIDVETARRRILLHLSVLAPQRDTCQYQPNSIQLNN